MTSDVGRVILFAVMEEEYLAELKAERLEMLKRHTVLTNDNCPFLAKEIYQGIERINKLIRKAEGGFFGS